MRGLWEARSRFEGVRLLVGYAGRRREGLAYEVCAWRPETEVSERDQRRRRDTAAEARKCGDAHPLFMTGASDYRRQQLPELIEAAGPEEMDAWLSYANINPAGAHLRFNDEKDHKRESKRRAFRVWYQRHERERERFHGADYLKRRDALRWKRPA